MRNRTMAILGVVALTAALVPLSAQAAPSRQSRGKAATPLIAREMSPEQRGVAPAASSRRSKPRRWWRHRRPPSRSASATTTPSIAHDRRVRPRQSAVRKTSCSSVRPDPASRRAMPRCGSPGTSCRPPTAATTSSRVSSSTTCSPRWTASSTTDVHYFGDYDPRPDGNDEHRRDDLQHRRRELLRPRLRVVHRRLLLVRASRTNFGRNMIFIDSYDWANRLGPNSSPLAPRRRRRQRPAVPVRGHRRPRTPAPHPQRPRLGRGELDRRGPRRPGPARQRLRPRRRPRRLLPRVPPHVADPVGIPARGLRRGVPVPGLPRRAVRRPDRRIQHGDRRCRAPMSIRRGRERWSTRT